MGVTQGLHGSSFAKGKARPKNLMRQAPQLLPLFTISNKDTVQQVSATNLCHLNRRSFGSPCFFEWEGTTSNVRQEDEPVMESKGTCCTVASIRFSSNVVVPEQDCRVTTAKVPTILADVEGPVGGFGALKSLLKAISAFYANHEVTTHRSLLEIPPWLTTL